VKPIRLAIVGATGLVGRTTLDVLREWRVPLVSLRLFASSESAGRQMIYDGKTIDLEWLNGAPPENLDAAIFATSREISRQWAPRFRDAGILVVDHSSQFRMDADVPLVIPEINGDTIGANKKLISNPNCSASVVLLPLAAIDQKVGLATVIVDTYQSVSGSGQDAIAELEEQLRYPNAPPRVYPRAIAHNVFPQVGPFDEQGLCEEERKVVEEIRKILRRSRLTVFTTTVRVPVQVGHSAAVTVECQRDVTRGEIESAFREMPGLTYDSERYSTPREIAGRQEIFVSRLRLNSERRNWLQFWVVGDNLRKGAASNAVQILMEVFK